jgi:hypothetical protein
VIARALTVAKKNTHGGRAMALSNAVPLTTVGVSGLIQAFIPSADTICLPQMCGAIKQIYLIAAQPDILSVRAWTPLDLEKKVIEIKEVVADMEQTIVEIDQATRKRKRGGYKATSPKPFPPATSSEARSLPPHTSVSHSTRPEEACRNETLPDRNALVESDHEPESDGESYVDLAGGITPTTTEDSDWSIVEA